MIKMGVSVKDGFDLQILFLKMSLNSWKVVSRINDQSFLSDRIPQKTTITLEGANGKGFDLKACR